ncbi:MAG: hypothetical protein KKE44_18960 [Proteobacteria bacterium]|nr:hypothetical protein [Pseudomonadota bacterium]MBU1584815.1 hypothetical protein [Pseudomonadota bacterium]MBU2628313.1 hypothetical protein [Pseudomonadota bacterium]
MINRNTVKVLNLKPVTRSRCYDFYIKINSEFGTPEAIKESVTWWQDDYEKLNNLWWVLNYYSDRLDPDRNLRAFVERHLDCLAKKKETLSQV